MKPRRLLRLEPGMPAENRPPASAAPARLVKKIKRHGRLRDSLLAEQPF